MHLFAFTVLYKKNITVPKIIQATSSILFAKFAEIFSKIQSYCRTSSLFLFNEGDPFVDHKAVLLALIQTLQSEDRTYVKFKLS